MPNQENRLPMKSEEAIKVINLTKKFKDLTAVNNISFTVKKGEIFGFLGPNGAGKSTTLSMLATLLEPTQGTALVNGFSIRKDRDSVRRSIGMVFQDPTLDEELTAYENMDFHGRLYNVPATVRKKKILELLKLVELNERKDSLVKTFSGGMRRRLEIARGLLHEPKVLFLDEPTLGLDPQTRNKLWEYIKRLNTEKGLTIILTTHYMDEADKLSDRIAIIDNGKMIILDTPENLKNMIGGEIITVETPNGDKLESLMKNCKWCKSGKRHDGSFTLTVDHADKKIPELVQIANKNKIKINSIVIHKPSLEDVFLHFTGKTIREQEAGAIENLRQGRRMHGRMRRR
ncbi:MAG: ATP-binding cassette domain-containing protein [Candidatus Pacearchaeota archaeon]|nr:ATP-binding cassette domain-containing protein [Candidatus Pacearchaeota archaeon]